MTNSEKKAYLRQYGDNEREIKRLEEELARWVSRAEKITTSYSLAPAHGESGDKIQVAVENITEVKSMLYDRLIDASELRQNIQAAIGSVQDGRLRNLLEYRYIDALGWDDVAQKMGYDRRWVTSLHGAALNVIGLQAQPFYSH
ncbi:MAG: hypothetical protein VB035_10030 [Candidatus Fimivivens sp.]|nr:hypothetical protein [Candidatus Fimivivens sp.]